MRWIFLLCLTAVLLGCQPKTNEANQKTVTVSILPQKYIVEQIAGNNFDINVIVPDGSGPETYEPTALQMQQISKSTVCFTIGLLDFEKSWLQKAGQTYPNLKIINTSTGIELITGHQEQHADHGHSHQGVDPHIWLSIKAVKLQGKTILQQLVLIDPANKNLYTSNYQVFANRMDSLDQVINDRFKDLDNPSFMIYHPSLSYFAKDYSLGQISIELDGKEPSLSYMKELVDLAKNKKINTIFFSEQFDKRSAQTIADQLEISLSAFNPLAENIEMNLLKVTEQIVSSTAK